SFKTYCTPLALPLPHQVRKGDRVRQSVILRLTGNVRPILPIHVGRPPQLTLAATPALPLPPLGLCIASHGQSRTARSVDRLRGARLAHLRVDLRLDDPGYPNQLARAATEASTLGVGLHLALIFSDHAEQQLPALLGHLSRLQPRILLWIILH